MKAATIFIILETLICATAQADPVTYILSGTGSGSLGLDSFTNVGFTITSTADTANITESTPGVFDVPDITASIFVTGAGTGDFNLSSLPVGNVDNQQGVAGISSIGENFAILGDQNAQFKSYDLSTSLAPAAGIPIENNGLAFSTTAGDFILSEVSSVTFQAEVVPEPSILTLLAPGALLLWHGRSRRPKNL